jgi:hypothetical protein
MKARLVTSAATHLAAIVICLLVGVMIVGFLIGLATTIYGLVKVFSG